MKTESKSLHPAENRNKGAKIWRKSASLPQLAKKRGSKFLDEVMDSVLWRIDAKKVRGASLAIGLSGCGRKSGSTSLAVDLAIRASERQAGRVLLIDANWRIPGLLKTWNLQQVTGLYDILTGACAPQECELQAISQGLDALVRGKWDERQPTNVRDELAEEFLTDLKSEYDLILVDLPAAEELHSALPLARRLDGTLLVARCEALKQSKAQRVHQRMQEDGVSVWGSILNRHREYVPAWLRSLL